MDEREDSDLDARADQRRAHSRRHITGLLLGETGVVWRSPRGDWNAQPAPAPRGVLSGSFNPLHYGHVELRLIAQSILQGAVAYELPLVNADKPPVDLEEAVIRVEQKFDAPLAVTTAPVFLQKAQLMPGVTFVVGADTAARIIDPRFYPDHPRGAATALSELRNLGCRFLVAARQHAGSLLTAENIGVPAESADLFEPIPEDAFRVDVSSSRFREQSRNPPPE
ncbi:MAG: hypothetical protein DWQ34_07220 [Planctomycetota bacterium]|nr:MAG: hypothetical protein DWQ29_16735 [Planctomycetota bacterium]REJ94993.1 MAG: hypothetical protein DWQ34_07220 [Planctomycetota bacterium]REK23438.1 MAG: hypothetical protein DWQ41_16950 [Planctomycetota bacterium]REK38922.1 MAG: hypothetical protein DWQ45_03505 [Planctomycetota bacterium]